MNFSKNSKGYALISLILLLSFIGSLIFIVFSKVSVFKARGQQSESRIDLVKVYNALYSYKLENGTFPDTEEKLIKLKSFKEIDSFIREDDFYFSNPKIDNIYITSNLNSFVAIYIKILSNGRIDIQRVNSHKEFCFMLNGMTEAQENCKEDQNFPHNFVHESIKSLNKIRILKSD